MKKEPKRQFTGNGPFSEINKMTTRIQMIKACEKLGIQFDRDEFADGVLNAEDIIVNEIFKRDDEE